MKRYIYLLFFLCSFAGFAQSVNDYAYVIVPVKFEFQKNENDYRLNTLLKFNLEKMGFTAFYSKDNLGISYNDRCSYLTAEVKELGGFLMTKLEIQFIDCTGKAIFTSQVGKSKSKDRKESYTEALNEALKSVQALNYKYSGSNPPSAQTQSKAAEPVKQEVIVNPHQLFAQAIATGYQLVDTTPKVVLKMFKTSQPDYYIAVRDVKNGVAFKKNNEWFFEYYENEKLVSEKLDIKF